MSLDNNKPNETTDSNYEEENSSSADEQEESEPAAKLSFRDKLRLRGFFSFYFVAVVFIFLFSTLVYIVSKLSPVFAEFWTRYPSYWIKFVMAKLSGFLSFSIAEWFILCVPILLIFYLVASWRATNNESKPYEFYKWLRPLVCVLLLIVSCFFTAFSPGYFRYTLDKNLSIEKIDVSGQELYDTAVKLSEEMQDVLKEVDFRYGNSSVMPYGYEELSDKINAAFKKYADKTEYINSFESNPKPIAFSELFTYTHISGVFTFMTGEANVNINFPDFFIPFTMAHEMSHQRGIAREDEANFVAFLVCMESDDAYVRYSGYSNMLNYLLNALCSADKDLYSDFKRNYYPIEVKNEFSAFSAFFQKYSESIASKVTSKVNDTFLKSQEQKAGTQSYGLVVDLAVAYYKNK